MKFDRFAFLCLVGLVAITSFPEFNRNQDISYKSYVDEKTKDVKEFNLYDETPTGYVKIINYNPDRGTLRVQTKNKEYVFILDGKELKREDL